jgi:aryl-alcohol dehydrogenase-like predicted oxidoreductase
VTAPQVKEIRPLGSEGLTVSPIGLGCMGMSEFYGKSDSAEAIRTIRRAVELGVTLFDTADIYGLGQNEELVGKALRQGRDRVVLATKFGLIRNSNGVFVGVNGTSDYVHQACDASLKRLGTAVIDLYQLHRVDPATPIEETVGAMRRLVEAGKVRHLGLSEVSVEQLRRAAAVAPITSVQSEYSLLERSVERGVLPVCEALGVGFVAFAPLMRGLIARRFTGTDELDPSDTRREGRYPRLHGRSLGKNVKLAQTVWEIAVRRGVPPSVVALAWLLARGVVAIPGAKTVEHLEQNLPATNFTLEPDELEALGAVVGDGGAAAGQRLPSRPAGQGSSAA